ncbi:MAG: 2-5 ligase [Chloroflexota bacterium]|jgi:2'-5' RNA ligase
MDQIRAFIAIDLPPVIQEALDKQTSTLRQILGNDLIRWVPSQNMHLTLKFLGSLPLSHLDFIKRMLAQTADSNPPFNLQIGGLGSFPNSKRPRVLWAGIHAPAGLAPLQKMIEDGATRLGYNKEERPFSPHLTLGRVRQGISAQELHKVSTALSTFQLGKISTARVDSVHLYQSDLHSEGSSYTKLFSATLR